MNTIDFKALFTRQLFLFVENALKQPMSVLSSLIAAFTQERYKNYKEQKRIKQLAQYRSLVLSQIEFYQEELQRIDQYKAEPQSCGFAEFFFAARERVSEQQLKNDLLFTICFDEFEIDFQTYMQMKLVEQYKKCKSMKYFITIGIDGLKISSQKQQHCIKYSEYMSDVLISCLTNLIYKQQIEDYSKCFLLDKKSISQIEEENKIKYEFFCTKLSRFVYQQRKKRNWTQEQLSCRSGINRSQIAKIETLRQIPTIETLSCLLTSLNADILLVASGAIKEGD